MTCEMEKGGRPVRVYLDGCFDIFHIGHANALRQASKYGAVLVAGSHSDEEIEKAKGPTVFKAKERYALAAACKWVDEFIPDAPYSPNVPFLKEHHIDYALHASDITLDEFGNDAYGEVKREGMYKEIERTQGVSTTDIINRMMGTSLGSESPYTESYPFIATASKLAAFTTPVPSNDDRPIVYCEGVWDVFNCGHLEFLKKASTYGRVICGILSDDEARKIQGNGRPIMSLYERAMSCLQCKYVSDVVLTPPKPDQSFIQHMSISKVLVGNCACRNCKLYEFDEDIRYSDAKKLKIFEVIHVDGEYAGYTTNTIINRVVANQKEYEERNKAKGQKELRRIEANKDRIEHK